MFLSDVYIIYIYINVFENILQVQSFAAHHDTWHKGILKTNFCYHNPWTNSDLFDLCFLFDTMQIKCFFFLLTRILNKHCALCLDIKQAFYLNEGAFVLFPGAGLYLKCRAGVQQAQMLPKQDSNADEDVMAGRAHIHVSRKTYKYG